LFPCFLLFWNENKVLQYSNTDFFLLHEDILPKIKKYSNAWMHDCMGAWGHGCMDAWNNGELGCWGVGVLEKMILPGCMDAWIHVDFP
jgi:hypothetical protein